ncbi:MAG: DUF1802 family protein [Myxococcales bacterium]|nr:DUF1802 family protein [Myxococcales bacterium]
MGPDPELTIALKEWAIVCAALGDGRQSVLVRKGGIHEHRARPSERAAERPPAGSFRLERRAFALLPTYAHAREPGRARDLIPAVHDELAALLERAPADEDRRVTLIAEVDGAWWIDARRSLDPLASTWIYSAALVDDRFAQRRPGLWLLLVRVYRLPTAAPLADLVAPAAASGCSSWVSLTLGVSVAGARAVIDDDTHARRRAAIVDALGAPLA